jgi:hypothetical protein
METLLYVLSIVIGALGTWFLLYFLKTRKTLRQQHELIRLLMLTTIAEDMEKRLGKCKETCEKKPTEQNDKPTPCEEKNEAK